MKKLKYKVFFVIFSLLTFFTLLIFVGATVKEYIERKNSVTEILERIPDTFANLDRRFQRTDHLTLTTQDSVSREIYLDFKIYTIILDNHGNYFQMINHTYNNEIEEDNIKKIANDIINNHKEKTYVGNLYTSRYSYIYVSDNILVIMDNIEINNLLISSLFSNIFLFLLCEVAIGLFTYLITKWIITPVTESFDKQKEFIADASHELKTPLAVVIASADAYFNDKDEKWIKNIKNESERMNKLVTDLLDLAKTEKEQDLTMFECDLSDTVESSILTFESLFYDNQIDLKYDVKPNIRMICNEDLIKQLIGILIDNAIKHCSEKGKVFVNLYKKNKDIILEVKNTGIPIKKEDEEKIFERFYKVDSSRNRNSNNYGLGLAIAKNIVLRHNGEISAHSRGGYTTFKVIWNQK